MSIQRFNIRVYMLLFDDSGSKLLLSDEIIQGKQYTKFPGGGVELGEGIAEALLREAHEELGQDVIIESHFYTTDILQVSKFNKHDQVVSVYYKCRLPIDDNGQSRCSFRITAKPFDFERFEDGEESFRWMKFDRLESSDMSFPIDKKVIQLLKAQIK